MQYYELPRLPRRTGKASRAPVIALVVTVISMGNIWTLGARAHEIQFFFVADFRVDKGPINSETFPPKVVFKIPSDGCRTSVEPEGRS